MLKNNQPALTPAAVAPVVLIDIRPVRADRFTAFVDGKLVVRSSRTPFLDAARALLAAGAHPETRIAMRHHGNSLPLSTILGEAAMRAILGKAAGLRVVEGEERPRIRRWDPLQEEPK